MRASPTRLANSTNLKVQNLGLVMGLVVKLQHPSDELCLPKMRMGIRAKGVPICTVSSPGWHECGLDGGVGYAEQDFNTH